MPRRFKAEIEDDEDINIISVFTFFVMPILRNVMNITIKQFDIHITMMIKFGNRISMKNVTCLADLNQSKVLFD